MPDTRAVVRSLDLPEHEAVRLIAAVTGAGLSAVRAGFEVDERTIGAVAALAERRLAGEPLQYLEGTASFGPLELAVDARVLIPRPETEQLLELVLMAIADTGTVVDVGTGSGALALALKAARPGLRVIATDISAEALAVARANADRLGLDIETYHGDLFDAVPPELAGTVDVIVSNPPYVAEAEYAGLAQDVRREPRVALVGGSDGLDVIRRLLATGGEWLAPGGELFMEIGEGQRESVLALASTEWLAALTNDLAGRPRFLRARRGGTIEEAVNALAAGQVVGVPTDTVYGLATSPYDPGAVQRLYAVKGRPDDKPIPVLAASPAAIEEVAELSGLAAELASLHWPGPLTLVVPLRGTLAAGVGDQDRGTVAVRIPDHPTALALLERTGPLAVTSANPSGVPPAREADEAWQALGTSVAVYVPGASGGGTASTVVEVTGGLARVLRPGPINLPDGD